MYSLQMLRVVKNYRHTPRKLCNCVHVSRYFFSCQRGRTREIGTADEFRHRGQVHRIARPSGTDKFVVPPLALLHYAAVSVV